MTGDGSDTTLALGTSPDSENQTFVTIDGVVQHKDTYAVSGSTLTFSAAPPTGTKVEAITFNNVSVATFQDADGDTKIQLEESTDEDTIRMDIAGTEVLTLTDSAMTLKGTTPTLTIGDAGAEDTKIVFDGNAQDFYLSLDDSEDMLTFGVGSTVGSSRFFLADSSQRVGLNGLNPSNYWTSADDLVLGQTASSTNTGMSIVSATNSAGSVYFADGTSGADRYRGIISYTHSTDSFDFHTNAVYAMSIDSSGKLGIGTTAPQAPLHIVTSSSETDLKLQSNTGGTGSAHGGRLILQLGAMSNSGSGNADTQAGDVLGLIRFDGQGTDYSYQGGEVSVKVQTGDGDDDRSTQGTQMSFKVMNVGVPYAEERFRISQNGDLTATDTTIGSLSDERIKKNIADFTGGLDLVKSLQPRTFEFKDETGKRKSGTRRGFVAQEVLEADDYWIYEQEANDKNDAEYEYTKDTEKVYVSNLSDKDAMYVSAIKELQQQIEALQSEINTLKGGD